MNINFWSVIPCTVLTLTACDVADSELEARGAEVDAADVSLSSGDDPIAQSYCDHADRVLRTEFLRSRREADGDLARDRERVLLDDLRAGEAVFAGAERLVLRGADELHIGFEGGWLVATAPGADAPLVRLRLANRVKVHVFADGVRKLVLRESVARADLAHLIVMTGLDGAVDVDVEASPACLVIDGGGDAAAGPFQVNTGAFDITAAPRPTKATIFGTNGNDVLNGTSGSDQIYAYAGTDGIHGGAAGDALFGNEDPDLIQGGDDAPNNGNMLYGGKANDILYGQSSRSSCSGDDGYDYCSINCGSSSCEASTGNSPYG